MFICSKSGEVLRRGGRDRRSKRGPSACLARCAQGRTAVMRDATPEVMAYKLPRVGTRAVRSSAHPGGRVRSPREARHGHSPQPRHPAQRASAHSLQTSLHRASALIQSMGGALSRREAYAARMWPALPRAPTTARTLGSRHESESAGCMPGCGAGKHACTLEACTIYSRTRSDAHHLLCAMHGVCRSLISAASCAATGLAPPIPHFARSLQAPVVRSGVPGNRYLQPSSLLVHKQKKTVAQMAPGGHLDFRVSPPNIDIALVRSGGVGRSLTSQVAK